MHRLIPALLLCLVSSACVETTLPGFCALPDGDAPLRGSDDAIVTIVIFADFQCPYCGQAAQTLQELLELYPEDVRLAYRHLPLPYHQRARPAAIAAICAQDQGAFWEYHDLLYANQGELLEEELLSYAEELDLDMEAWQRCLTSLPPRERLDTDEAAAELAGVGGTPTIFVNGEPVVGSRPLEEFIEAVDRALVDAADSGLEAEAYYDSLVELGCGD